LVNDGVGHDRGDGDGVGSGSAVHLNVGSAFYAESIGASVAVDDRVQAFVDGDRVVAVAAVDHAVGNGGAGGEGRIGDGDGVAAVLGVDDGALGVADMGNGVVAQAAVDHD